MNAEILNEMFRMRTDQKCKNVRYRFFTRAKEIKLIILQHTNEIRTLRLWNKFPVIFVESE